MNVLITGSNGQLGQEIRRLCVNKKNKFFTDFDVIDITKKKQILDFINLKYISFIINCAAFTDVRKAELNKKNALMVNSDGVKNLTEICEKKKIKMIHISTDYIYNGKNLNPIKEKDFVDPQNYYGFTKREGEKYIENSKSESIVIRTSWLYSKFGNNFVNTIIKNCHDKEKIEVVNDQYGCPTYAKDLAEAVMKILESNKRIDEDGKIFNYSNEGSTSWFNFARKIVELYKSKLEVVPVNSDYLHDEVKRPKFTITCKNKITKSFELKINNWDKSLNYYIINDLV